MCIINKKRGRREQGGTKGTMGERAGKDNCLFIQRGRPRTAASGLPGRKEQHKKRVGEGAQKRQREGGGKG